jgi:hypothetical protein
MIWILDTLTPLNLEQLHEQAYFIVEQKADSRKS